MEMEDIRSASQDSSEGLKINLEQMQLNELQKISSQLETNKISGSMDTSFIGQYPMQTSFSPVSINGVSAGGVINTQPYGRFAYGSQVYGMPTTAYGYGGIGGFGGFGGLNQAITMGAMALAGNQQTPQGGITSFMQNMKENNDTLIDKMFNKLANFPLIKYGNTDYSRTNDKGVEAIQEQNEFAVQRAGIDIAQGAASIGGGIAGMGVGSTIGTAIGSFVAGPIGGVVGNIAGGIVGGGVGSSVGSGAVGIVKDQIQDRQDYSTYLQENAYKFINSMETNNSKVNSGFTASERKDASKWLANLNTDFNMTDDEINTILQNVTESGMLKSVSDLESFKKKFSSLVKTVKEGAMTLNLSYEEMSEMLADLNKKGIKSDADQALMIDKLKGIADLTGMDISSLYGSSTNLQSLLYNGTATDPTESLANSAELTALGATYMEQVGQKIKTDEDFKEKYGFSYNYILSKGYSSEELAQQMAISNGTILDPNNSKIGESINGMLGYAAEFDGGNITGFNQERINELNKLLSAGDLQGANELGRQWMSSDKNAGTIVMQLNQMSGTERYGYLMNTLGSKQTGQFLNSIMDAYAANDGYIEDKYVGTGKGAAQAATHYGLDANAARNIYEYNEFMASSHADSARQSIQEGEQKSSVRRNSSKNQPVGFFQGIKNKFEQAAQGVTDFFTDTVAPSIPFRDTVMDWVSGDSAMRAGYGSAGFNIDTYKDIYNDINSDEMQSLFKKAKITEQAVNVNDYSNQDITKSLFGKVSLVNANATLFGTDMNSTASLKKVVENNKDLTSEERDKLLNAIATSEGQTQSAVTGYLELAQDIGGDDYRKKLIKNVDVEGYGSFFSGMKLDDLADPNNIKNLSLDSQKQIQDQLPKVLAEQLAKDYKGKDTELIAEFKEMFSSMPENEIYQKAIEDNKLDVSEIEDLVNELQKVAYTTANTSGDDGLDSTLSENGEKLSKINKALQDSNKTTEDTLNLLKQGNEKQEEINKHLQNQNKNLDQRVTSLSK